MVRRGYNGLKDNGVTRIYKVSEKTGLQKVTTGYKRLQGVNKGYRGL